MKTCFINKRFSSKSLKTIQAANDIIKDYQAQGFQLTLRQLYYQFVSRDLLQNVQSEYKRLGSIINDARLAGLIDWRAIEDRTRSLNTFYFSELGSARSILESAAYGHERDHWVDQPRYVEVWIEKDALVGVIEKVCSKWRVPYFACRGYNSQSEQYKAGRRLAEKIDEEKTVTVLHLGDHDPSGLDMTDDNQERLTMFSGHEITLKRLALNMDQVEQYNPPPNPAKETDARYSAYAKKHGKSCWELDALEPKVIEKLVEDNIKKLVDMKAWKRTDAREEEERQELMDIARNL
jgi:hypothetical protein